MTPDHINGVFEALGAVAAWRNVLQLSRDGAIRGVYWPIYWFYSAWGAWNLYYYRALGQTWSLAAGGVLFAGNVAWVVLALRVWRRDRRFRADREAVLRHKGLRQ